MRDNKSRICNRRIDALLREGQRTFDTARRKEIYGQLQSLLYRELPIVLIYDQNEVDVFTDALRGQSTSIDGAWWNVAHWSLAT